MRVNTNSKQWVMSIKVSEKYIGQFGRPFVTRVKEHVFSFQNCSNSKLDQHLLHYEHAIMILDKIRSVLLITKSN
jgi:hypothetical protein